MRKSKKLGLLLVFMPLIVVAICALIFFVLGLFDSDSSLARSVDVGLGLFGILAVTLSLVMIPVGVHFLRKKDGDDALIRQSPEFQNLTPEQLQFVRRWSWGAFFGTPVWAFGNRLYVYVFLSFVPLANFYAWLKLSLEGRQMAWQKGGWDDFDHFRYRQKVMAWVILIINIFVIGSFLVDLPYNRTKNSAEVKINRYDSAITGTGKQTASAETRNSDPNDPDGDGLPSNYEELFGFGSSPTLYDTDSDGYSDAEELQNCFDPTKPSVKLTGQDLADCEELVKQLKDVHSFLVEKNAEFDRLEQQKQVKIQEKLESCSDTSEFDGTYTLCSGYMFTHRASNLTLKLTDVSATVVHIRVAGVNEFDYNLGGNSTINLHETKQFTSTPSLSSEKKIGITLEETIGNQGMKFSISTVDLNGTNAQTNNANDSYDCRSLNEPDGVYNLCKDNTYWHIGSTMYFTVRHMDDTQASLCVGNVDQLDGWSECVSITFRKNSTGIFTNTIESRGKVELRITYRGVSGSVGTFEISSEEKN